MTRFGYLVPIVINEQYEIGDGEHRAQLYKKMGLTEIPAYIVPKINDDIERRLLRQTMNKLHGEHEVKMDSSEIALIFKNNKFDDLVSLIAQPRESLENILTKHQGIQFQHEDNFDVEKTLEDLVPETQLGDIWQLGNHKHRIICADCSDERSIDKLMEGKKADMVFTDPPYYIMGTSTGFTAEHGDDAMVVPFFKAVMLTVAQNLKFNNHAYICCNWRSFPTYYELTKQKHLQLTPRNLIVWSKPNMRLGGYYTSSHEFIYFLEKSNRGKGLATSAQESGRESRRVTGDTNVWIINTITDLKVKEHGAQKPTELVKRAVENSSDEGDLIFDPFLGSGTTLITAQQTNRICYGCEIDPKYCQVTIKRWEAYTGKKAIKQVDE